MSEPLYMRIRQYVRQKIESGEWAVGEQIPPESALGKQFGCSRITVTTALRELAREGLIDRVQGKGSFVSWSPDSEDYYDETLRSHTFVPTDYLRIPGRHECVGVYEEPADEQVTEILHLKPGQQVIRVVQIKYIEDTARFVERLYLPRSLFAAVPLEEVRDLSLSELAERCDMDLDKSYISSEPVICDAEVAQLLGIPEGSAIMRYCIEMYDTTRREPVCCEYAYSQGKQGKTLMK
ncbi:MAG TPA: hypothetical protein DCS59_04915 [Eubacterium sp.]|nr:hypothetical protein [Eubacterium sp.]